MSRKGFTLVEVIVILAVIAILAGIAVPVALRIFERTAEDTTREEMDNLKKAMIGDPQKLQSSFRSDFGFLGDIGCLPTPSADGLDRLLTNGTLPTPFTFDSAKQAGAGWNGPYITGTPGEDFKTDQWGNNYTYTVSGTCPLTATLTSSGASTSLTSDDITLTIASNETTATVRGTVKDTGGNLLEAVPVEFYSAVSGTLSTAGPVGTDVNGNYSFTSVPFGPRAVKAKPNFLYALGSVTGAGTTMITFNILNYAESAVAINRMKVDWSTAAGPKQFNRIRIDLGGGGGLVTCFSGNTSPGVEVTLTCAAGDRTVAASTATRPSSRVFIDSFDVKLADTIITGPATPAIIEIRFIGGNVPAGTMPTTVTFNPSPLAGEFLSVVKFTP
ncbi:MAG: prepilin-type N-terminal cleavage/methylation domain-containing protein [Deltaproteobacteria bacterium]|nr:prepilin-type N-terminal cleavage/methylation domain-containing protein [Deltaproteobacteria bacterium]